jgi:lysozyme family protein
MADFNTAIEKSLSNEGVTKNNLGYVNDPKDRGGETVAGISYNNWPNWAGWAIVHAAKKQANFPRNLVLNTKLFGLIVEFYKVNFWDKIGGDKIKDQNISNELVDAAILEGIKPAIKRAQAIVMLPEDGKFSAELANRLNNLA